VLLWRKIFYRAYTRGKLSLHGGSKVDHQANLEMDGMETMLPIFNLQNKFHLRTYISFYVMNARA
jgi:hypothetical protein